jgi:hypothetical protein
MWQRSPEPKSELRIWLYQWSKRGNATRTTEGTSAQVVAGASRCAVAGIEVQDTDIEGHFYRELVASLWNGAVEGAAQSFVENPMGEYRFLTLSPGRFAGVLSGIQNAKGRYMSELERKGEKNTCLVLLHGASVRGTAELQTRIILARIVAIEHRFPDVLHE